MMDDDTEVATILRDVTELRRVLGELRRDVVELLDERNAIRDVLRAFYMAPVTISSIQPILDLAVRLSPTLPGELALVRAEWGDDPTGGVH